MAFITQNIPGAVKHKMRTFRDGGRSFSDILAIQTPGHAPGHSCLIAESKDQSLFVGADLALQRVCSFVLISQTFPGRHVYHTGILTYLLWFPSIWPT